MKCPKCGFNSFEFLDSCKKCGVSLASFKKSMGVNPIVFAADRIRTETQQTLPTDVPHEEAFLQAAPVVQADDDIEETFTWDIPALSETAPEADTKFSGFELGFIKDDEKPQEPEEPEEPEAGFSFNDEPVAESPGIPATETSDSLEEFSFYENTLEPVNEPLAAGNNEGLSGSDAFGETGVIGEISPEQLQAADQGLELSDCSDDTSLEPGSFENEFAWEDISAETENTDNKEKEIKKESLDISAFEKDFESIFQTDDTRENGKTGN